MGEDQAEPLHWYLWAIWSEARDDPDDIPREPKQLLAWANEHVPDFVWKRAKTYARVNVHRARTASTVASARADAIVQVGRWSSEIDGEALKARAEPFGVSRGWFITSAGAMWVASGDESGFWQLKLNDRFGIEPNLIAQCGQRSYHAADEAQPFEGEGNPDDLLAALEEIEADPELAWSKARAAQIENDGVGNAKRIQPVWSQRHMQHESASVDRPM